MTLPKLLAIGGVVGLLGMVAATSWVLPGVHASQMRDELAHAAAAGVPEAPEPNIPGRLDGQGVGQDRNENRDVQVEYWQELGEGGDGSRAAAKAEGRGKGRGKKRDPDAPVVKSDGSGPKLDPKVNPPMHDPNAEVEAPPVPTARPPVEVGPKFIPVPEFEDAQPELLVEGGARPEFDRYSKPPEHDPQSVPPEYGEGWVPLHDRDREARQ